MHHLHPYPKGGWRGQPRTHSVQRKETTNHPGNKDSPYPEQKLTPGGGVPRRLQFETGDGPVLPPIDVRSVGVTSTFTPCARTYPESQHTQRPAGGRVREGEFFVCLASSGRSSLPGGRPDDRARRGGGAFVHSDIKKRYMCCGGDFYVRSRAGRSPESACCDAVFPSLCNNGSWNTHTRYT